MNIDRYRADGALGGQVSVPVILIYYYYVIFMDIYRYLQIFIDIAQMRHSAVR